MNTHNFRTAAALLASAAALLVAPAAVAKQTRHTAKPVYGEPIGTYSLRGRTTVQLGRFPSVAAAVAAARKARLAPGSYGLADTPSPINHGRVAIDSRGVVHPLMQTAGSGPGQRPPVDAVIGPAPK